MKLNVSGAFGGGGPGPSFGHSRLIAIDLNATQSPLLNGISDSGALGLDRVSGVLRSTEYCTEDGAVLACCVLFC